MDKLLKMSLEEKMAVEIMYMAADSTITRRKILVTSIQGQYVKAFCFTRNQKRTFNRSNILAAARPRKKTKAYA